MIELSGLELAVDPAALAELLEVAQASLGRIAASPAYPADSAIRAIEGPDIGDNAVCDSPPAPARIDEQGFDDFLVTPIDADRLAPMLSRKLTARAPAAIDEPAPAGGAGAAPLALDADAMARLRELDPQGANRLIERVLTAFQTSAARLQPQLDAARASGDRATIRLVAHTLKSSSASIGALHLSQLCAHTETAIRLESADDLNPSLDALTIALAQALRAIDVQLKAQP
ncbi:MAG: Hpt domain-containing protein [Caldimonas sp.]